jgi:uncharacterized phage protein (TIGR01671 family)
MSKALILVGVLEENGQRRNEMREIKFRAWDKTLEYMIQWDKIEMYHFYDDDFILMQYTGIKDACGKEIYEGDVVCIYFDNNKNKCKVRVIEYNNGMFYCMNYLNTNYYLLYKISKDSIINSIIILDNIYENPTIYKANLKHKLNWDVNYTELIKELEKDNV